MSVKLLEDQNDVKYCMTKLESRSQVTPDFPERRKECNIPVFVYGTLKRGHSNHGVLNGATFQTQGYITHRQEFGMRTVGTFPVVYRRSDIDENITGAAPRIMGELYSVDVAGLHQLDQLEGNGYLYQREQVSILIQVGDGHYRAVTAWVYIGIDEAFDLVELDKVPFETIQGSASIDWYPNEGLKASLQEKYKIN